MLYCPACNVEEHRHGNFRLVLPAVAFVHNRKAIASLIVYRHKCGRLASYAVKAATKAATA